MIFTWERPVFRARRFPNGRWSQLRFSDTGPPPSYQGFIILKPVLKHRVGNNERHRRVNALALVRTLHGTYVLVLVHLDGQVRERPLEQRVVVVVDPFRPEVRPELFHRRRERLSAHDHRDQVPLPLVAEPTFHVLDPGGRIPAVVADPIGRYVILLPELNEPVCHVAVIHPISRTRRNQTALDPPVVWDLILFGPLLDGVAGHKALNERVELTVRTHDQDG